MVKPGMTATRHAAAVTFQVDLLVNDGARGVWGQAQSLTLHKRSGESRDHIVLKLMGAILLAGPRAVVVEPPLRVAGYKPDVAVVDDDGRPVAWVECGDVAVHKLDRLTRALGEGLTVLALKKGRRPALELARALQGIARPGRVVVLGFDGAALDAVGEALNRSSRSRVVATVLTGADADDGDGVEIAVSVGAGDEVAVVVAGARGRAVS
jgi:hypothetical protein